MNVYRFQDYRQFLKSYLPELKKTRPEFSLGKPAKASGVQNPYLSKVLHGDADFNADQLFLVGEFLGLAQDEVQYLLLLLEHSRSHEPRRKKALLDKITATQNQNRQTKKHIKFEEAQVQGGLQAGVFLRPLFAISIYGAHDSKICGIAEKNCAGIGLEPN